MTDDDGSEKKKKKSAKRAAAEQAAADEAAAKQAAAEKAAAEKAAAERAAAEKAAAEKAAAERAAAEQAGTVVAAADREPGSEQQAEDGLGGPEVVEISGDDDGPSDGQGTISELPAPTVAEYDPTQDRENIRGEIAKLLVWALLGSTGFALFSVLFLMPSENREAIMDVLQLVYGPLVGLVGAVTGFYFGGKTK